MADTKSGPSTATIVLIAVLVTPIVLIVIFWAVGSGSADAGASLPDVNGKGLQWAQAQIKDAGFHHIETHDALGRNRRWSDDKDWKVCFELPAAGGNKAATTKVQLGAVKIEERCPITDQAIFVRAVTTMPNLRNRTAYLTRQILGDDASIAFTEKSGAEVNGNLGDWRVCSQAPAPGQPFEGVPVSTLVVPYDDAC